MMPFSWPESRFTGQFLPEAFFAICQICRHLNPGYYVKIALFAVASGKTPPANAQALPVLRAGRNLDVHLSVQSWHRDAGTQCNLPRRKVQVMVQIAPFNAKIRVAGHANPQIQVACFPPPSPGSPWPVMRSR